MTNGQSSGANQTKREWWRRPPVIALGAVAVACAGFLGAVLALAVNDTPSNDDTAPLNEREAEVPATDAPTVSDPPPTPTTFLPASQRVLRPGEVLGIPFDAPIAKSMANLGQLLGEPDSEESTRALGGYGHFVYFGALNAMFYEIDYEERGNYALSNWSVYEPSDWVTDRGIGVGDSVDELLAAYPDLTPSEPGGCFDEPMFHGEDLEFVMDPSNTKVIAMGSPFAYFC